MVTIRPRGRAPSVAIAAKLPALHERQIAARGGGVLWNARHKEADMCVLAMAWHAHPDWQLVVIANQGRAPRSRQRAAPRSWPEGDIIAGQDLLSGGTWLGVSPSGRFAAVTNRAGCGTPSPTAPSRGVAVRDIVRGRGALAAPELVDLAPLNPLNLGLAVTPDAGGGIERPSCG